MSGALRRPFSFALGRLLVAALGASILSKGVWHPWYFLWLIPALALSGRRRGAIFVVGALPLFYLPVVFLRATGDWWMPVFYVAMGIYILLFAGYIFFENYGWKRADLEGRGGFGPKFWPGSG